MINETNKIEKVQLVIDLLNECLDKKYLNALNSELDIEYAVYYDSDSDICKELHIICGNDEFILDISVSAGGILVLAVSVKDQTEANVIFDFTLDEKEWISCDNTLEKFEEYVKNEN